MSICLDDLSICPRITKISKLKEELLQSILERQNVFNDKNVNYNYSGAIFERTISENQELFEKVLLDFPDSTPKHLRLSNLITDLTIQMPIQFGWLFNLYITAEIFTTYFEKVCISICTSDLFRIENRNCHKCRNGLTDFCNLVRTTCNLSKCKNIDEILSNYFSTCVQKLTGHDHELDTGYLNLIIMQIKEKIYTHVNSKILQEVPTNCEVPNMGPSILNNLKVTLTNNNPTSLLNLRHQLFVQYSFENITFVWHGKKQYDSHGNHSVELCGTLEFEIISCPTVILNDIHNYINTSLAANINFAVIQITID